MSGLGLTFLRRGGLSHPTAGSDYIKFADAEVLRVLIANGVSYDGVGVTKDDAARVTTFGTWFKGNTSVQSFDEIEYFTGLKSIAQDAFSGCTSLYFENLRTPTIESIGRNAFFGVKIKEYSDMSNLKSLPNADTTPSTFGDKSILERIVLPSVATIPAYTLYQYINLQEIVIPEGVQVIGGSAFRGCQALKGITLPSTINNIGSRILAYNEGMEYCIILAVTPPTSSSAESFAQNKANKYPIYVPDESVTAYQSANNWTSLASRIKPLSEFNG